MSKFAENTMLDYENDHYCPVYKREISPDLCYDSMLCLNRYFKISSTREIAEIEDIESARAVCRNCQYFD